jgi:hypothetical protein
MERPNVFLLTSTKKKTAMQSFNAFIDPYLYVYISILRNQGKALGGDLMMHFFPHLRKRLPS